MQALIKLLRPHQWIKNGFVFVGLLFGHAWQDPEMVRLALVAFAAFCLLASSVYVMNDLADREQDKLHPDKRHRPLASGAVGTPAAVVLGLLCGGGGLGLAFIFLGSASWIFVGYLLLNAAYSSGLKHVVILDVFMVSAGFMLRLLAGTTGIGIAPSHWLLLCGLMLTLFLGFAKRRAELNALGDAGGGHRRVLAHYSPAMLDQFLAMTAMGTVVTYGLYTVAAETVAQHGTSGLMLTVPFVLYGTLRYLYRLHRQGGGGDPAYDLVHDGHLLAAFFGWLATVLAVLTG
jgi:4-hydroxybenzoate polyprenyltransferase